MGADVRNAIWRWTCTSTRGNGVELMPVYKSKNRSGAVRWGYMFSLPGSSRNDRRRISESGFATKREAEEAEARRRIDEQRKLELAKACAGIAAQPPRTLAM